MSPVYMGYLSYMTHGHCPDWLQDRIEQVCVLADGLCYELTDEFPEEMPIQVLFFYKQQPIGIDYPEPPSSWQVRYPAGDGVRFVYFYDEKHMGMEPFHSNDALMSESIVTAGLHYYEAYVKPAAYQVPGNGMPSGWYLINSGEWK